VSFQIILRLFFHADISFGVIHDRAKPPCKAKRIPPLEISNSNTRSNLIALAEYKGSQLKPDHHSPADAAGRFRATRWSVALLSAEIAAEGRLGT
jgi:hypothetical protein